MLDWPGAVDAVAQATLLGLETVEEDGGAGWRVMGWVEDEACSRASLGTLGPVLGATGAGGSLLLSPGLGLWTLLDPMVPICSKLGM